MKLTLDIVSDSPTLNAYNLSKSVQIVKGQTAKVILRLWQEDRKIRYIPSSSAVLTIDLKKSDQDVITKTLTPTFADDRSIQEFSLSAAETTELISQNLVVKIVDGSDTYFAILQKGVQKLVLDGVC